MKLKSSLKSTLKFWQEIVFVISIGYVLFEIFKFVALERTMNGWEIFLVCFFLPLFVCLIGQFFWKNQVLAFILSPVLGFSSLIFILACLYALTTSPKIITSIAMLIFGIILLIAAITMPVKNQSKVAPDTN